MRRIGLTDRQRERRRPRGTTVNLERVARLHATRRPAQAQGPITPAPDGDPVRGMAWAVLLALPLWAVILGLLARVL
jgi:hypothetical protein